MRPALSFCQLSVVLAFVGLASAGTIAAPWGVKPTMASLNRSIPRANNLIGYWPMLENGVYGYKNLASSGLSFYYGNVANTVPLVLPCQFGPCFYSNNNDSSFLGIANDARLKVPQFSVECWFYVTATPGASYGGVISFGNGTAGQGFVWTVSPSNVLAGGIGGYNIGSTVITHNKWYHMVFTFDGTTEILYLNGVLNASGSATMSTYYSHGFVAGKYADITDGCSGGNCSLTGKIDLIAYYNRALTAAEVQEQYNFPLIMLQPASRLDRYSPVISSPAPGTIKSGLGSNDQTITITLASLGASATACRASTAVDNTSNLYLDAIVFGTIETGTVSGDKEVLVYAYGTADGGTTYSGQNGSNAITGTDAAFTRADPTDLKLLGVLATPTSSVIMGFGPYSVAKAFGGVLPDHWGIVVCDDTGAAFSGTAGNNKAWYQGILGTIQ